MDQNLSSFNRKFDHIIASIRQVRKDLMLMKKSLEKQEIPTFPCPPPYEFDPMKTIGKY
jgi:hypothetical protein